jgi:hypothetical protein
VEVEEKGFLEEQKPMPAEVCELLGVRRARRRLKSLKNGDGSFQQKMNETNNLVLNTLDIYVLVVGT